MKKDYKNISMPLPGLEPGLQPPQGCVLSIKL